MQEVSASPAEHVLSRSTAPAVLCLRKGLCSRDSARSTAYVTENSTHLVPQLLRQPCYHMLKHRCRMLTWAAKRFMKGKVS